MLGKEGEKVEGISKRVQNSNKAYLVALYTAKMQLCKPPVVVDVEAVEKKSKNKIVEELLIPLVSALIILNNCDLGLLRPV